MGRNDDNNNIIRNARKKSKIQNENKTKENFTKEEDNNYLEDLEKNNLENINFQDDDLDNEEESSSEYFESKSNKNNKKKIYIGILCFMVLIGVIYFATRRYDNLVYPNITLYNENVSKLNKDELNEKVAVVYNDINNNKIVVKIDNKNYEIKVKDIIQRIDKNKTKNEIINYGKNKFFLEQFGLICLNVKKNYNFNIKINNNEIEKKVSKIFKDTSIEAIEPTLNFNEEKIEVVSGKSGKCIDENDLKNKIIDAVNTDKIADKNIVFKEEYKIIKPKINEKDLKVVKDKISTATTYFGGTGYNRGLNIANAASKIDKTLLMPGEEFSYEDKVSPVELYNGYYLAPVIVNGTHKNAPGGGVCQVSTTLYNAELKAGILPTERHNHSKAISYVQRGLDATLATGSKNLRFKNPYKYPIYIHAYTYGGQITVEFWSNKSVLGGKKYTPVSFVKRNVANVYLYGYNSKGELIYNKFVDTSIYR
ncbi:VanW family protein [Terrisporobacter sp.]